MAHQTGPLRLEGKLGDLSFYHNRQYGYLVRQKGGPDRETVINSPRFARTRENAAEFAIAAAAGKLIRQAVKSATGLTGDLNVSQRLTGLLVSLGKTDFVHTRGLRSPATVLDGAESHALLRSFVFFKSRPLNRSYCGNIACDADAGIITFTGPFSADLFQPPKGATHVRIKAAVVAPDFDNGSCAVCRSPECVANMKNLPSQLAFSCDMTAAGAGIRKGIVAIEFLQEKNGELYALAEGVSMGFV